AVAVPPQYTSQECSSCGRIVKKSLSTRTHACECGTKLDRDENAALNILREGIRTVGRTETAAPSYISPSGGEREGETLGERSASTSTDSSGNCLTEQAGSSYKPSL
ncbi:MAG: zinc ribbon domain-containing protein, partial [Halothece sp.]